MKMNNGRNQDRHKEAVQRQEERSSISDKDQLKKLDKMFGKGKGAIKERKRLNDRIQKQKGVKK